MRERSAQQAGTQAEGADREGLKRSAYCCLYFLLLFGQFAAVPVFWMTTIITTTAATIHTHYFSPRKMFFS